MTLPLDPEQEGRRAVRILGGEIPDELRPILTLVLAEQLDYIRDLDPSRIPYDDPDDGRNYDLRNRVVIAALSSAGGLGLSCGIRYESGHPNPVVVYIDLPNVGQVSWHLPEYTPAYDGHNTPEKYDRIRRFLREVGA